MAIPDYHPARIGPLRNGRIDQWAPASPWAMRDAAYELLQQLPDFKKVFKVQIGDVQPEHLPCLVMDLQDTASKDQGNQGMVGFKHNSTMTWSISCAADSTLVADGKIWALGETALMQVLKNKDFPKQYAEGFERMSMSLHLPRQGETFLAVLNITLEMTTVSQWEPIIPDKLRELMIQRRLTETQTETGLDEDIIFPDWQDRS